MSADCRFVRKGIHAYLDGEMSEASSGEVDRHLAGCERCRRLVVEFRSVASAVGRTTVRHQAPPHLAVLVRQRLDAADARRFRPSAWELLSRRPVSVFLVLVLVITAWMVFRTEGQLALAREVTRDCFDGHRRCANSPLLPEHVFTADAKVLSQALSEKLGVPVEIPDLTSVGYSLIEGHNCSVRGQPSAHAYYRPAGKEGRISFFHIPGLSERGSLGEVLDVGIDAYTPPLDCWQAESQQGMNIVLWREGKSHVCVLLGPLPKPELEEVVTKGFARQNAE